MLMRESYLCMLTLCTTLMSGADFSFSQLVPQRVLVETSVPGSEAQRTREQLREAGIHYERGVELYRAGNLDAAIAEFRNTITLDPRYAPGHYNLGVALFNTGDTIGAIAAYREAIRLRPELPNFHYNLGVALRKQGDFKEAAESFREVTHLEPFDADAHCALGSALKDMGDFDGTIAGCGEAVRLQPSHASAWFNLAEAQARKGMKVDAAASYRRFLALTKESAVDRDKREVAEKALGEMQP